MVNRSTALSPMTVSVARVQDAAWVTLTGDVDMLGVQDLATAARTLTAWDCATMYLDLTAVTFAGAVLLNFIAQLAATGRPHTELAVAGPSPIIRDLIIGAGFDVTILRRHPQRHIH